MLSPPDLVERLVEVLGDMKLVVHDLRLRGMRADAVLIGLPHVDGHRFEVLPLSFRQRFPDFVGRLLAAAGNDLQHLRPVQIGQGGDVVLSLAEALLVEADVPEPRELPPRQTPLDRPPHDRMRLIPRQPDQLRRRRDAGRRLQSRRWRKPRTAV